MKKLFAFTCLWILILMISSCKKKDVTPSVATIVGKWTFSSATYNDHYSGSDHVTVENGVSGEFIQFNSNGTYSSHMDGSDDTGTYSVANNKLTIDGEELDITTLTANSLTLYGKEVTGGDYYEATLKFLR